ncbi:MAG: hypothetical protein HQL71_09670 [Magnetococcales bacterium]|nr:hypothetical protein [Magnetococcales bacterium]
MVLDLDGDGIELIATNGLSFGMSPSINLNPLGWVGHDDGVLAFDRNNNGTIDDITELFSEHFNGESWKSGMDSLTSFDSNADGLINADDSRFDDILIWKDEDSDGVSLQNELYSLPDIGINSISLNNKTIKDGLWFDDIGEVLSLSHFDLQNGQSNQLVEVGLLVGENKNLTSSIGSTNFSSTYDLEDYQEVAYIFGINFSSTKGSLFEITNQDTVAKEVFSKTEVDLFLDTMLVSESHEMSEHDAYLNFNEAETIQLNYISDSGLAEVFELPVDTYNNLA